MHFCSEAVDEFEHSRVKELKEKRRRRRERIAAPGSFRATGALASAARPLAHDLI